VTRIGKTQVSKIIRRLKGIWAEQNSVSAELDEIRSRLCHASTAGSDATARRIRSKTAH
jgi:hypothetical protein